MTRSEKNKEKRKAAKKRLLFIVGFFPLAQRNLPTQRLTSAWNWASLVLFPIPFRAGVTQLQQGAKNFF